MTFLDMDGVLFDFVGGARRIWPMLPADAEWPAGHYDAAVLAGVSDAAFWNAIAERGTKFWRDLEPYGWAMELAAMASPFVVLSSPSGHPSSLAGKRQCLDRHLAGLARDYVFTPKRNKKLLAAPGRVLVDDHEGTVDEWVACGGTGILFPRPWNRAFAMASDPMAAVRAAMPRRAVAP